MGIPPPSHPDPEAKAVEAAIRRLTPEQWEAVRKRLSLCPSCGALDADRWCCYDSRPGD